MRRLLLIMCMTGMCIVETSCRDVNITWLVSNSTYHDVSLASSVGAITLAISAASNLTGDKYNILWVDPGCDNKASVIALHEVFIKEAFSPDLLLGPQCSNAMVYIGQFAGFHNLPSFGWVSESYTLRPDSSTYNTMLRLLPPINSLGDGIVRTLKWLDWHTVFIIASSSATVDQYELGEVVNSALTNDGSFTIVRKKQVESPASSTDVSDTFTLVQTEARIVILCVPFNELSTWMLGAYTAGITSGDYVFIYVNAKVPSQTEYKNFLLYSSSSTTSEVQKAAMSLLMLTPRWLDDFTPGFNFMADADHAAETSSLVPKYHISTSQSSDIYSPYLYDAFLLYAILSTECGPNNGSCFFHNATNREFSTRDYRLATGTVIIDSSGDRLPELLLLDMGTGSSFGIVMQTVNSVNQGQVIVTIDSIDDIVWGNGKVGMANKPPDIPVCGFSDEKCPKNLKFRYYVYAYPMLHGMAQPEHMPVSAGVNNSSLTTRCSKVLGDLSHVYLGLYIGVPVAIVAAIVVALVAFFIYRKYQFENSIKDMVWKINKSELQFSNNIGSTIKSTGKLMASRSSIKRSTLQLPRHEPDNVSLLSEIKQLAVKTAKYHGTVVAVKKISCSKMIIDRDILIEMTYMTNVKHNNLATFIGATTEPPEVFEAWEFGIKGSLQDIIWNESIKLDNMFKFSIAIDILKGLKYLQDSQLKFHGKLRSSNIVVDGRWVCKLTDYGLCLFHGSHSSSKKREAADAKNYQQLYWTAPELLRPSDEGRKTSNSSGLGKLKKKSVRMSAEGDIYAVAIILKEVFARNSPYSEYDDVSPKEIISFVQNGDVDGSPFRPKIPDLHDKDLNKIAHVIRVGWSQRPSERPTAQQMLRDIQKINPFKSANVMDNMIRMMERYSNNLEEIVSERTQQVEEEKKKSETLLYRMLPKFVAEKLKIGEKVEAEAFDAVTIYFSDIVKFTNLSAESTPMQVVTLLNGLYTLFDSTSARHDVYKVETIGDAYMLVSGLPQRNGDRHAVEIANCAMELLSGVLNFKVQHKPGYQLQIRIGLHTGPAVAGIVGLTMPRYCLFGGTVANASSMESGGLPMRIHLSEMMYKLLSKFPGYHLALRGSVVEMKGFGVIKSYWLYNREGYNMPLPDFKQQILEDDPKPIFLPVTVDQQSPTISQSEKIERSGRLPAAEIRFSDGGMDNGMRKPMRTVEPVSPILETRVAEGPSGILENEKQLKSKEDLIQSLQTEGAIEEVGNRTSAEGELTVPDVKKHRHKKHRMKQKREVDDVDLIHQLTEDGTGDAEQTERSERKKKHKKRTPEEKERRKRKKEKRARRAAEAAAAAASEAAVKETSGNNNFGFNDELEPQVLNNNCDNQNTDRNILFRLKSSRSRKVGAVVSESQSAQLLNFSDTVLENIE